MLSLDTLKVKDGTVTTIGKWLKKTIKASWLYKQPLVGS